VWIGTQRNQVKITKMIEIHEQQVNKGVWKDEMQQDNKTNPSSLTPDT